MAFGSDALNLLFRIKADGAEARTEIEKTSKFVTDSNGRLRDEFGRFAKSGSDATTELDKLFGSTGASLTALINPAALATAGIAAVGSAAAVTGKFLLDLAEKGSEFGDSIYDATIKTGLSAESVSALALAAAQSGVSLDAASNSVAKFEKNVASAKEGNKSAIESMERLFGKDWQTQTADAETALDGVFKKVSSLQDPYARVKAATDAFGKSGIDILKIIDQTGGSFEDFKKKAQEAGLVLSKEDVQASNDFQDALKELEFQGKVLTAKFVSNYLPQLTNAIQSVEKFFASHQEGIKSFGQAVAGVIETLGKLVEFVSNHPDLFRVVLSGATLGTSEAAINAGQSFQQIGQDAQNAQGSQPQTAPKSPFVSDDDDYLKNQKDQQKAAKDAYAASNADIKRLSDDEKKTLQSQADDLKRSHDKELIDLSSYVGQRKQLATETLKNEVNSANQETAAAQKALDDKVITDAEASTKLKEQQSRIKDAQLKYNQEIASIQDDAQKEYLDKIKKNFDDREAVQKQLDETRIAEIHDAEEKGTKSYADGEKAINDIMLRALKRRDELLAEELQAAGDNLAEKKRIQQELKVLDADYTALYAEGSRRYNDGLKKDLADEITKRERINELTSIRNQASRAAIDDDARTKKITLVDAVDKQFDIDASERIRRKTELESDSNRQTGKEREETLAKLDQLEAESTAAFEDYQRRRRDAIIETNRAETEDASRGRTAAGTRQRVVPNEPITTQEGDQTGLSKVFGGYAEQSDKVIRQNGALKGSFKDLATDVKASAGNMVGALQNAIEGYLLYGNSISKALKQAAAAELAHISSVSAIKAIYQLAEGFAALFIDGQAAASHFTAAALYGSVAIGAGIGARALADKSQINSQYGSSSGSSNSISNNNTSPDNTTKSESRKQTEESERQITLKVVTDGGQIVKIIGDNISNRGDLHGQLTNLITDNT